MMAGAWCFTLCGTRVAVVGLHFERRLTDAKRESGAGIVPVCGALLGQHRRSMGTADQESPTNKPGLIVRVANSLRVALPTWVGGVVTVVTEDALMGASVSIATRELIESDPVRRLATHVGERLSLYSRSTHKALPPGFESAAKNPNFDHAFYQNYRRAMDAIDPVVIPALGRLTALYCDRQADRFFRGVGHILEGLTAQEFDAFRHLLSAVIATEENEIQAVARSQRGEMRVLLVNRAPLQDRRSWVVKGLDGKETNQCLRLLDRHDIAFESRLDRETAQTLEQIFGARPVELEDRYGAITAF